MMNEFSEVLSEVLLKILFCEVFNKESITKKQEKIAERVVEVVERDMKLPITSVSILGYDPTKQGELIKSLKNSDDKLVRKLTKWASKGFKKKPSHLLKVILELDGFCSKLVYVLEMKKENFLNDNSGSIELKDLYQHLWTGVFDFDIPFWVLFGRAADSERDISGRFARSLHGNGGYCFAPASFLDVSEVRSEIESGIRESLRFDSADYTQMFLDISSDVDQVIDSWIVPRERIFLMLNELEDNPNIQLLNIPGLTKIIYGLDYFRKGAPLDIYLWTAYRLEKAGRPTGVPLIDTLNGDAGLLNAMKGVLHYGDVKRGNLLGASWADVSTICTPFRDGTLFQVVDCEKSMASGPKVINSLARALYPLKDLTELDIDTWREKCRDERRRRIREKGYFV